MTESLTVEQMAERLLRADNVLVLCHKNPDGDTVGSGCAMYHALRALDKTGANVLALPDLAEDIP